MIIGTESLGTESKTLTDPEQHREAADGSHVSSSASQRCSFLLASDFLEFFYQFRLVFLE